MNRFRPRTTTRSRSRTNRCSIARTITLNVRTTKKTLIKTWQGLDQLKGLHLPRIRWARATTRQRPTTRATTGSIAKMTTGSRARSRRLRVRKILMSYMSSYCLFVFNKVRTKRSKPWTIAIPANHSRQLKVLKLERLGPELDIINHRAAELE